MTTRGIAGFEIDSNEHVINNENNLERLRAIFLDRKIITGELLGPGDPGDFDFGGWHVLCHLVSGCAVFKNSNSIIWVEISHVPVIDSYTSTITVDSDKESVTTYPLLSIEGQSIIQNAKLIGFVEGSSLGHISARDVHDAEGKFNTCTRQEFDMDEKSYKDGGRVWEHWATTRNITSDSAIGTSVLRAYLSMVSLCGGSFIAVVARGRIDYSHPAQLNALVQYGLLTKENILIDILPKPLPKDIEEIIYTSDPKKCVKAIKELPWDNNKITYFMFERRINKWNSDINN